MKAGLRRRDFKVKDLDVSGRFTGGIITPSNTWYVDADSVTGSSGDGSSWDEAFITIQEAIDAASARDTILIAPRSVSAGATDPANYVETLIIPADKCGLSLIGVDTGRTQGGLPQIRIGDGGTALLTIRAPNCVISNLGFNGIDSTGGGILLDDDALTKTAFGTTIMNCHFKNCVGATATDASTGGAIMWATTAEGAAWQVLIKGNRFYKNVGDIVSMATLAIIPQDVIIEDNIFSGPAANVDCNLYLIGGGSGMNGVIIRNNEFTCFPNLTSGENKNNVDLTGCVGLLSGNRFACSGKTFGAAGNNLVPTTVLMADNYQEDGDTQIKRTAA